MARRVFITGMGVVSPLGNDVAGAFERLCSGESAVRRVQSGSVEQSGSAIVAPAEFATDGVIPRMTARLMARAAQMAVLAAGSALESARLVPGDAWTSDAGLYVGCAFGGSEAIEDHYRFYLATPPRRSRAATVPMIMANGPASHVAMHFRLTGPSLTYSVACVSSAVALGEAFRAIRDGYIETAIAGGAEAQLNPGTGAAWMALGALASEHSDGPQASCRPFDAQRSGLVLGEGAAILVLESEESLNRRGGVPLAEMLGYGASSDAHNLTEPLAAGQASAMIRALADGGLAPADVGYINAHATGTLTGDKAEWTAIAETFGERAREIPVSASKGAHGHLIGATSALEAVWTVLTLQSGRVPPTANLTNPDPECPLDCVPLVERRVEGLRYALSNSFAFGGTNAVLVLGRA